MKAIDENGNEYPALRVTETKVFEVEIINPKNKNFGKKYRYVFTGQGQGYQVLDMHIPYDELADLYTDIEEGTIYGKSGH